MGSFEMTDQSVKVVPCEPTQEMLNEAQEQFPRSAAFVFPKIWKAMLDASPIGLAYDYGFVPEPAAPSSPVGREEIEAIIAAHNVCDLAMPDVLSKGSAEIAALFAPPAPDGWRPIETAPRDGTVIDVWRTEGGRETVFWGFPHHDCGEMGRLCDSDFHSIRAEGWVCSTFNELMGRAHNPFTHWQPLPAPPALKAGE